MGVKFHGDRVQELNRIFLVGASGFLGCRLFDDLRLNNHVLGSYFRNEPSDARNMIRLDLTDKKSVRNVVQDFKPNYLINCAGMTSVDDCENRPEAALMLNSLVPQTLAEVAKELDCHFIHISTDHFFSSDGLPRNENVQMIPVNQYGYSKLLGERLVKFTNPLSLILRTNFFGLERVGVESLFNCAIQKLPSGEKIRGVTDILFNPIGITTLSEFICKQINLKSQGIINVAGTKVLSKFEFLVLVRQMLGMPIEDIVPVKSNEMGFGAPRPKFMALDTSLLLEAFEFRVPELSEMIRIELKTLKGVR